jgi:hypothetical protein
MSKKSYTKSSFSVIYYVEEVTDILGDVDLIMVYYNRQQLLLATHTLVISFDVTDGASLSAVLRTTSNPCIARYPFGACLLTSVTNTPVSGRVWTRRSAANHRHLYLNISAMPFTESS